MEENYLLTLDNDNNGPSDACIQAILNYSKTLQSFEHEDIRFKVVLN
jgi:hypothetical protein